MRVADCLSGSVTNVDADVVSVRFSVRFNLLADRSDQLPYSGLLLGRQCEEVGLVASRDDEAVAGIQGKRVVEGNCQGVVDHEFRRRDTIAKSAGHGCGPYHAYRPESQQLQERPDGSIVMTLHVCDDYALRQWILGYGRLVPVLAPGSLVESLSEEFAAAREQYASGGVAFVDSDVQPALPFLLGRIASAATAES